MKDKIVKINFQFIILTDLVQTHQTTSHSSHQIICHPVPDSAQ